LQALGGVTSLKQLYVFGSRVTTAGVAELRAKLPECVVGAVQQAAEKTPTPPENSPSATR
jgi:hypothetical protein